MRRLHTHRRPLAVILGTNEIASAVAVHLVREDYLVIMVPDPDPPVLRRGMAFHDALFDEPAALEGIRALRVDSGAAILGRASGPAAVLVTGLGLCDLLAFSRIAVLVDARMQKRIVTPVLRHLADRAIGIGPGFIVGQNCDAAVETLPERNGIIVTAGATDPTDGVVRPLGGVGRERFLYSTVPGCWRTSFDLGQRLYRGMFAGMVGDLALNVPIDGVVRGVVRDGTEVPAGVKLMEIDPRGRAAQWTGIEDRARRIALATVAALAQTPAAVHRRDDVSS